MSPPFPAPSKAAGALLRAAAGETADAATAWRVWIADRDLWHVDAASFALLPAVYARLRGGAALGREAPRLAGIYRWTWVRNQVALRAGARALESLAEAGIQAVALKGLPLLLYYGDLGSRMMFDVDLMVPESRLPDAWACLVADGWKPEHALPGPRVRPYLHAATFRRPGGGVIDLHWKLLPVDVRNAGEGVRARALERPLAGITALVPEPVDLALLGILHAVRPDPHTKLRWAADLAALAHGADLDWDLLQARAGEWGFPDTVRSAVACLHHVLGVVPEAALTAPAPPSGAGERRLVTALGRLGDPRRSMPARLRDQHWTFRQVGSLRGLPSGPVAFARHVLDYYQTHWETRSVPDTLRVAVRRAIAGPTRKAHSDSPRHGDEWTSTARSLGEGARVGGAKHVS